MFPSCPLLEGIGVLVLDMMIEKYNFFFILPFQEHFPPQGQNYCVIKISVMFEGLSSFFSLQQRKCTPYFTKAKIQISVIRLTRAKL